MVLLRRFTPLFAVSLLVFLAACQDQSSPAGPLGVDVVPSMSHVTTDHVDLTDPGLFFFRPPIDTDELTVGSLDTNVQELLSVELCNVEGLVGFDPFASLCPAGRLVARLADTDLSIVSAGSFDFYQGSFGLNGLGVTVGDVHTITVMFGLPDGTSFAYGYVPAIFTDNASEADPDADPPVYRVGELPIKFYVSDLATRQLVCGDVVPCTFEVWDLFSSTSEDLCFPDNDCDGSDATAGLRADPETLQEIAALTGQSGTLVVCTAVDPVQLEGLALPIVLESWVDCDLGFDGELESTFAVQLCLPNGVQDREAFAGAHFAEGVLDFLAEGSGPGVFSEDNCQNLGELAENAGLLERMRYAALNGVLRPVARFLGPRPLLAWNVTTWDSNKASPLGPAELLELFANQGPEPIEVAGSTVPVSVCVAAAHLDPPVASGNPVDVHFEVTLGGGSIAGTDPDGNVTAVLRPKTADDDCDVTDGSGQIAAATVMWTLGSVAALNELTASIPGEFAQIVIGEGGVATSEDVDLSVTFSTQTVEVLGQCTGGSAFDEFGHRGIYILPSEFGMVGDDLNMVQLRISSNNSTNGKGLAGEYRVSLSARDGSYDPGATIQTVETTFTLSGDAPENETVTFSFDQLQDLGSAPVAFVAEILDAPKQNARLYYLVFGVDQVDGFPQLGSLACPGAIVTNGTTYTTPLDTDRRQGVDIRLLGVNNDS